MKTNKGRVRIICAVEGLCLSVIITLVVVARGCVVVTITIYVYDFVKEIVTHFSEIYSVNKYQGCPSLDLDIIL